MAKPEIYNVNPVDGVQLFLTKTAGDLFHEVSFRANGAAPAGSVVVAGRKFGSDNFESIPDATFDLSALETVQFTGGVIEYSLTITGISGVSTLQMFDTVRNMT